jgi:uncharacterized protein
MQFRQWNAEWDEDNIEHIAQHDVEPEDVEEIVYEDCYASWIVRGRRRHIPEPRWVVFGQTCAGRYLVAVVAPYRPRRVWRTVTAFDMSDPVRRRYQRWRND